MVPTFSLSIGGADRTAVLKSRLLKLNISTSTGKEADELEMEFDDRGSVIAIPSHGAVATVAIGYLSQALVAHGAFTVDETEINGPPDKIKVKAKSSDMRASLKAHKSRAWRAISTGDMVAQIAAENGLSAQVHPSLSSIQIDHLDQTNESDLHFLTRHGQHHDAVASAKGGAIVFAPKGLAVSGSGRTLGALSLTRTDLEHWNRIDADRHKHGRVRGRHHDYAAAATSYVDAGEEEPTRTLRHAHTDADLAGRHAHARHRDGKRKSNGVELKLAVGLPTAFAGQAITLSGIRTGINGRWVASKVEHEIDFGSGGFKTTIHATVDGLDADAGDGTPSYGGDDADPADTTDEGSE